MTQYMFIHKDKSFHSFYSNFSYYY